MKIDYNEVENNFDSYIFLKIINLKSIIYLMKFNPIKLMKLVKEILFPVEELGLQILIKTLGGNKNHKIWVYKYENELIWNYFSYYKMIC